MSAIYVNQTPSADPAVETATPILEVQDVTVSFGGLTAVADLNLVVPPREIIGLIGPNGAGKSTSFNVMSGMIQPKRGRVLLGGVDVTKQSIARRARSGLARTFQHPEIFTALTVRENIVLAHRMRHQRSKLWSDIYTAAGFRSPEASERELVDSLIEQVGLTDIANQTAIGLPLGYARLLEIARVMALAPRIVLMDEPTSGLDTQDTERLSTVLRDFVRSQGVSLLLVEHDVGLVLGLSNHIYVLDFGKLIAEGGPDQIRSSEVVRAAYLGKEER